MQHAADVAQHGAGLQLSEGDDLGHAVMAVLLLDVAQHLVPTVLAEIDVEVRHRDALGVEEALEQQVPAQRVEVGDGQRPGDHRTGAGAAPRPDRNALRLGPPDEVGDDQEIAGKAHLGDDAELVVEPLAIGLGLARPFRLVVLRSEDVALQPPLEPGLGLRRQLLALVAAVGGLIGRQDGFALLGEEGAAARHRQTVVDCLRQVLKKRPHLLGALEVMLRRQPPPLVVGEVAALGNAEQNVVGLIELGIGKEDRVGRDQRQVLGIGEIDERRLDLPLALQAVALDLDIEAPGEDGR